MARKRKTKGEPKRIVGFKLTLAVTQRIKREAAERNLWPAHVVEEMARERYGLSQQSA